MVDVVLLVSPYRLARAIVYCRALVCLSQSLSAPLPLTIRRTTVRRAA
jgi:hypothetical protein